MLTRSNLTCSTNDDTNNVEFGKCGWELFDFIFILEIVKYFCLKLT